MDLVAAFGGTFDPIHYGHLRTVEQVGRQVRLACVYFLPAGQPPHRKAPEANARHRFEMVQRAVAAYPMFVADGRELERTGPSYTVDTLRSLRAEFGAARCLGLILGMDSFLSLPGWHDWESILDLTHLLVMHRPGWSPPDSRPDWWQAAQCASPEMLQRCAGGLIYMLEVQPVGVSATEVRRRLQAGAAVDDQLPAVVANYIQCHGLYR